jgi:hypothetical protein
VTDDTITISLRTRFQMAMILAIVADALQLVFLPFFVEGAESPADDILDLSVGAALFSLLGWHWEFLPSFACQAGSRSRFGSVLDVGGCNVYRKSKRIAVAIKEGHEEPR